MKLLYLSLIPLLLFFLALVFKLQSGPYWLGTNSDPEYVYLLNTLNLVGFKAPGFYFHPGTPLLLLGAPVVWFVHVLRPGSDLVTDVLKYPEIYLHILNLFLLILLMLTVFLCGVFIYRLSGKLTWALVLQSTPFLTLIPLQVLHRMAPEPLLLIAGIWFSYLVLYLYLTGKTAGYKFILLLSAVTGFLIALKIDSGPLVLIPLCIFYGNRRLIYLFMSVGFFVIFTLPVISRYPQMLSWFTGLFIHSGNYGVGRTVFIDFPVFWQNVTQILILQPLFLVLLGFSAVVLFYLFPKRKAHYWYPFLSGITICLAVQLLGVSKHFNYRYLVPPSSLAGLWVLVMLSGIKNGFPGFYHRFRYPFISFLILMAVVNTFVAGRQLLQINPGWREAAEIHNLIASGYAGSKVINYYGSSSLEFSLKFANDNAGRIYTGRLSVLYPGMYFYNLGFNTVTDWEKVISLPMNSAVLFQGVPFTGDYARFTPDFDLEDIYHGQTETIYLYHQSASESGQEPK